MAEQSLVDHLLVAAERWPDRPAWTFDTGAEPATALSFLEVARRSAAYAQALRERGVDAVTLVGFMANNCILASAAQGEALGLTTEVLSDAVGAVNLRNRAGKADARAVHATLMALLHSNWAAVAATDEWCRALGRGAPLPCSNLVASAVAPF